MNGLLIPVLALGVGYVGYMLGRLHADERMIPELRALREEVARLRLLARLRGGQA